MASMASMGLRLFYGITHFYGLKTGFAYIVYIMISAFADALHIMP